MSNPIEDVMNGLVESFDRDTPNEITYKEFMSANKDSSLYDIFNTYDMAATEKTFIVTKIIKQKYGITHMSNELFEFIYNFPSILRAMERRIEEEEGSSCCVDKAWSRSLKKLEKLIEKSK